MKSMLIAAAAVGTALAGLVLYARRQNKPGKEIEDAATGAHKTINGAMGSVERPAHHAMG